MYYAYKQSIEKSLKGLTKEDWDLNPFGHAVIDNFLSEDLAQELRASLEEMIKQDTDAWNAYNNPLENKYVFNRWDKLAAPIYAYFSCLQDPEVVGLIENLTGIDKLIPDSGLHGGGVHLHKRGGKLNVHQDYSLHPKTKLQRRLNIILYLNPVWDAAWNGGLGLYTHDESNDAPKDLVKVVNCVWNRAVLFDTAPGSWHGLPDPLTCPEDIQRVSLAYYYTREPVENAPNRKAVRFAPSAEQVDDEEIKKLIELRSNPDTAKLFYKNTN